MVPTCCKIANPLIEPSRINGCPHSCRSMSGNSREIANRTAVGSALYRLSSQNPRKSQKINHIHLPISSSHSVKLKEKPGNNPGANRFRINILNIKPNQCNILAQRSQANPFAIKILPKIGEGELSRPPQPAAHEQPFCSPRLPSSGPAVVTGRRTDRPLEW